MKKCPYCNNKLQQVAQKLICIASDCKFQCKLEEFEVFSQPWGVKICKNEEFWNYEVLEKFPYIISAEYKRLYTLLEENKLYGVLFQIKDFFEVLIKFPVLLILSRYCDNRERNEKQSEIIKFLLENKLSLGHWETIANKCLNIEDSSSIIKILKGIVELYNTSNITTWRNDTIGHGVLKFDDSNEFRKDIENKLLLIKKYLDEFSYEYINLNFGYKDKNRCYRLQGLNTNLKNLRDKNKLYFYYEDNLIELNNLILIHNKEIYFFDSYFKSKKKTKLLNYVNAKTFQKKIKYFEELFNNISKEVSLTNLNNSSLISDDIYMSNEEELLNKIEMQNQIIKPKYIYEWLKDNITNMNKGIFLLRMEEGMGKTVFSKLLDPHSEGQFSINDTTIRSYYINNMYSYKIDVFRNNLIDILKYDDKKRSYMKGSIPTFKSIEIEGKKKELVEILKSFKAIYQKKFGKKKLLLILDGLDEINITCSETIFDYIPFSEMLDEGIYLLLTARISSEKKEDIYTRIDKIKSDSNLIIDKKNENYKNNIRIFLKDKCKINDQDEIKNILQLADNKFLYIKPIQYVLKYKEIWQLNKKDTNIFNEFIELVKGLYTEKYCDNFIKVLLIICLSREKITIEEISYLFSGDKPDFKFIAYISDISCLLSKSRSYRGNAISIAHNTLRSFLLKKYAKIIQEMTKQWLDEVLEYNNNYEDIDNGKIYLIFNSLYIAKNYNRDYINKIIKKINIQEIRKYLSNDIKKYEINMLINFCDDYIGTIEEELTEKHSKKNLNKLIDIYIYKVNTAFNYGISSEIAYLNDLNRIFELLEIAGNSDINQTIKAYELRSNYFREIGNIKKSMDDINEISKIMLNIEESNIDSYQINDLSKVNIKLQKAINLKNLRETDDSLKLSYEALELINTYKSTDAIIIKSNILNNIALCYKANGELDKAKDCIIEAIALCDNIKQDKELYNCSIYLKYANLGQILRKKGELEESLNVYNKAINTIKIDEMNGYIISKKHKMVLYNGRGNIFLDFEIKNKNNQFYNKALDDYIIAEKIIESIDKNNQDMIFLTRLYSNIAKVYNNFLNDTVGAQKYINRFNEVRKELFRKQLDITDIDEETLERIMLINCITKNIDKASEYCLKREWDNALNFYQEALEILENSEFIEEYEEIRSVLYYGRALCRKNMLQNQVNINFSLRKSNIKIIVNDYKNFRPNEIIDDFLEADKYSLNTIEHKSEIYNQISYVYCEALRDYNKSKIYARKAIETGVGLDHGYFMLASCYYEEKDYVKAIENFKKILPQSTDYERAQKNIIASEYMLQSRNEL